MPCRLSSLCPENEQYLSFIQRMKVWHKKRWKEFCLHCSVNLLEWESDFWDGLSWLHTVDDGGWPSEILNYGSLEMHTLSYPRLELKWWSEGDDQRTCWKSTVLSQLNEKKSWTSFFTLSSVSSIYMLISLPLFTTCGFG